MRTLIRVSLLPLLLTVPISVQAQQRPAESERATEARDGQQRQAQHTGLGMLLRHRTELGLTDVQISRLEAIAKELEGRNRPLLRQLREAGIPVHGNGHVPDKGQKLTKAEEVELRKRLEAHRPVLHQLRANTRAAMMEAHGVLTSKQRDRLRAIMDEQQRSHRVEEPDDGTYSTAKSPHYGD
jgi:hypothetical protein